MSNLFFSSISNTVSNLKLAKVDDHFTQFFCCFVLMALQIEARELAAQACRRDRIDNPETQPSAIVKVIMQMAMYTNGIILSLLTFMLTIESSKIMRGCSYKEHEEICAHETNFFIIGLSFFASIKCLTFLQDNSWAKKNDTPRLHA